MFMHIPFLGAGILWFITGLFAVSDNVLVSLITAFFACVTSCVGAYFAYKVHAISKVNSGRLERIEDVTNVSGDGLKEVFGQELPNARTKGNSE